MSSREAFDKWWRSAEVSESYSETAWAAWQAAQISAPVVAQEPCARIYIHPQSLAMRQVPIYDAQSFEAESPQWEHHGDIFFRAAV